MRDDFAIFILTHGRPNNQKTLATLNRLNYKGKVYLVLDNLDATIDDYYANYDKDSIIVFDKYTYINKTDTGLSLPVVKFAVFARNAIEDIARNLGYKYFMMLDDDITAIRIRMPYNNSLKGFSAVDKLDILLDGCIEYIKEARISCLGLGFCNSYRAGLNSWNRESSRQRLCAEAFIRNTDFIVDWRLNMVEDLITSLDYAIKGDIWLQFLPIQVEIYMSEGKVDGGNSDAYNDFGKFKLSFFPILPYPAFNSARFINDHWVTTTVASNSVPKIISDSYKKKG